MELTKKQLEEQYHSLSNSRLESIATGGTHSATAIDVAINELRSRGVAIAEPIKKELEKQYQSLSNAKLERIAAGGTHSATAVEVAINELLLRGVQIANANSGSSDSQDVHSQDVAAEENKGDSAESAEVDLQVVYTTDDVFQANVIRNLFDSEGVFAYVRGLNLGVVDIIWSFAGGGMRVEVRKDQVAHAKEILAKYKRGEYKIADEGET